MSSSLTPQRTYQAFISYRHADNTLEGRQWATWLHQAIETYQVPEELVGKKNSRGEVIPERIFPIFRDEDELPADADLGNSIANALKASRLLVVVCSPNAVASTYVADEIDYFKRLGHSDRIIAMIIDGEPNVSWDASKLKLGFTPDQECFPEPLQFRYDDNGERTQQRAEPIAADFRVFHEGKPRQAWTNQAAYRQQLKSEGILSSQDIDSAVKRYGEQQNLMLLKIIAGILGVPLGELTQRDKAYQLALAKQRAKRLRQWLAAVGVLALVAMGAGIWAYWQQQVATQQRDTALVSQSRFLLNQSQLQAQQGNFDLAILLGLNAMPGVYGGERPFVNELAGVRMGMQQNNKMLAWRAPKSIEHAALVPNSDYVAVGYETGQVDLVSLKTGLVIAQFDHKARIDDFTVSPQGKYLTIRGRDSRLTIWSLASRQKINDIAMQGWSESVQFTADETAFYTLNYPGYVAKYAVDSAQVMMQTEVFESADRLIVSPSGQYVAITDLFATEVFAFDGGSGKLLRHIPKTEETYSNVMRPPQFSSLSEDVLLVYSNQGTHTYSVTSEESNLAAGYHMVFAQSGKHALMLSTGARIDSANANADALNSLAEAPIVVDLENEQYMQLKHGYAPLFIQFGAPGQVYSGFGDSVWVWNHDTGEKHYSFKATSADLKDFDAQQQRMLAWNRSGHEISVYQLQSPQSKRSLPAPYQTIERALSPSGAWLLVFDFDNQSVGWLNTKTGQVDSVVPFSCDNLWRNAAIIYSEDEAAVAIHCKQQLWVSVTRGQQATSLFEAQDVIAASSLAVRKIAKDGQVFAKLFVWRTQAMVTEINLPVQSLYAVNSLTLSSDGQKLIAEVNDSEAIWLYDVATSQRELEVATGGEATWLSEPKTLAVHNKDAITFWRANQSEPLWRLADGREYTLVKSVLSGRQLLVHTETGELLWLDVASQQRHEVKSLSGFMPSIREYPSLDLVVALGSQWRAWRVSDQSLIVESGEFEGNLDIALDSELQEWVKVIDKTTYVRYPAWLAISVDQARQFLPVGKACLTNDQRAQYYLAPLTHDEQQQRGCR